MRMQISRTKRQKRLPVSQIVKYGYKKSPGRLHTRKNDWKVGGGAHRVTSVAAEFGINKSCVSRTWKAFQTTGTAVRKVGGSRPRMTTAGDDRYIILQAKRDQRQSASVIAQQLSTATGGSVIGDRCCEEVLLPHVRLFRGVIGPDFIFMDDNARPHRTLAVEELIESEDISQMDWPAYSPDLNPNDHVWDALRRRIAARLHHPENTQQLKQMLIEEWALLPQEMLHQLVLSMRRRCEATIALLQPVSKMSSSIPAVSTSSALASLIFNSSYTVRVSATYISMSNAISYATNHLFAPIVSSSSTTSNNLCSSQLLQHY
ncbi:transposable element Tcb2 transposase [Trichonephila clavipes]|nr:transposable element Tcb2 transposase [Trichonephila clavipes]